MSEKRVRRDGAESDVVQPAPTSSTSRAGGGPVQRRSLPRTLPRTTAGLGGWVQRKQAGEDADAARPADVGAIAATGVAGGGQTLPHLDKIQAAFGSHDVSGVDAHVGGAAAVASEAIGARAYATGSSVAFQSEPDLHLAAHEAAHVVQQRAGVHLKGGVGESGDVYEQHADQVADAVVRGESAQPLLDQVAGGGGGSSTAVQRDDDGVPMSDVMYTVALKNHAIAVSIFANLTYTQQKEIWDNTWMKDKLDLLQTDIDDKRREQLIRHSAPVLQVTNLAEWTKLRGPKLLHRFEDAEIVTMIGVMADAPRQYVFSQLTVDTQLRIWNDFDLYQISSFLTNMSRADLWSMFITAAWDDKVVELFRGFMEGERWRVYSSLTHEVQDRVERLCGHVFPDLAEYIANHKGNRKAASMGPTDQERLEQGANEVSELGGAMVKFDASDFISAPDSKRISMFRRAPILMKPVMLALEPGSKLKMLDRLEDSGEKARTLLAYTRSTGDTLPIQLEDTDTLREMIFFTEDPKVVGQLFSYLPPQKQDLLAIAMTAQQLAHFVMTAEPGHALDVVGQLHPETKQHIFSSLSSSQLVAFYQSLDPQWRKDVLVKWLPTDKLTDLALSIPEVKAPGTVP